MYSTSVAIIFVLRCVLVALFLPFSALDKILNTKAAIAQAGQIARPHVLATLFIVCGGCIEVLMSLAIVIGVADRLAAFVLAIYCLLTALLWKRFWNTSDFRLAGASKGRDVFWDFLKNTALAGALFLFAFGNDVSGIHRFFLDPFASTNPYQTIVTQGR